MAIVKCSDCGFLAVRRISTQELQEATTRFREHGDPPPGLAQDRFEQVAVCFARKFNLPREYEQVADIPSGAPKRVLICIGRERECDGFTPWQQGFTPKEHLEMLIEEAKRRSEERRDEAQRTWQAAQAKQAEQWHRENLAAVIDAGKSNVSSALKAAGIGAAATAVVGILGVVATLGAVWLASVMNTPANPTSAGDAASLLNTPALPSTPKSEPAPRAATEPVEPAKATPAP